MKSAEELAKYLVEYVSDDWKDKEDVVRDSILKVRQEARKEALELCDEFLSMEILEKPSYVWRDATKEEIRARIRALIAELKK